MAETNGKLHNDADEEARMWWIIDQIQERNTHVSPDEALAEVTAEVEAVRQEMYEQREQAKTSGR